MTLIGKRQYSVPDHILSIILPLYSWKTYGWVIGMRLVGVKVHGIGDYVYLVDTTVKGGANLMIKILWRTLLDLETCQKLPTRNPMLYLQLDNCSENKNKVLFGFLADLVDRQVFDKFHVGFLMVGHTYTHEDIDQFFSVISAWLKRWETIFADVHSLQLEILKAFTSKQRKPPQIFQLCAFKVHCTCQLRLFLHASFEWKTCIPLFLIS